MILHIVFFKPRADLTEAGRGALVKAFERATREIPTVRGVRVGRRVRHGAGYEAAAPDVADYSAILEFDDLAGLQAYLNHPAHAEIGARFSDSLAAAIVYDVEISTIDAMRGEAQEPPV